MTTDWKALCAQLAENVRYLLDCVADGDSDPVAIAECVQRLGATRAVLSQPEPEGLTDEELHDLWLELYGFHPDGPTSGDVAVIARAVLARWGSALPTPQP